MQSPSISNTNSSPTVNWADSIPRLVVAVVIVISFLVGSALISYSNIRTLQQTTHQITHSRDILAALDTEISLLKDAETGQRGYIITGDAKYLEPYTAAVPQIEEQFKKVSELVADDPSQQAHLPAIKSNISIKLTELAETANLRRDQSFDAARARVMTDRGKIAMDNLRGEISAMDQEEQVRLKELFEHSAAAFRAAVQGTVLSALCGIFLTLVVTWLLRKASVVRQRQAWIQSGYAGLNEQLIGDQHTDELSQNALRFLCEYLGAKAGVIFVEEADVFRRFATYAVPADAKLPDRFKMGEGLLGQAAKDAHAFVLNEIPDGYLSIGSGFGHHRPQHLLIAPAKVDGVVNAVLELGFFAPPPKATVELLTRCAETFGVAVRSAEARRRISDLLAETQRQAEELQTQSEELRVSNEELEEQTRALQRSQSELEQQQVEMEEANTQLEEQTRTLESQRDELTQNKSLLENQARVVEQASRYKSNFLANMSHELRTPLNSSLILAQILTENREGNLNDQQIEYARTIQSSGNDLLALINDVLDLSKIEAGRMDVNPQPIVIGQLLESLKAQFEPVAKNRKLALHLRALPGAPASIETDSLRLEQVLRNLLSNALKFTEEGEVTLEFAAVGSNQVSFAVKDTGIGIDRAQQDIIFEPFCQADGTTNRKYGGTGLGLSISRDLARLLGGELQLASEPGRGSIFTVVLPVKIEASEAAPAPAPAPHSSATPPPRELSPPRVIPKRDDANGRLILIVEDDPRYAEILTNLAKEKNFQSIVTASAQEALVLASEHLPNAILLDIGLPDDSGLLVLDRLKHDARTRHIPVHVISGSDYAEKAIEMGAVGYLMKPVPQERLADAFQNLELRLTHKLRRVLVVEDDNVQRAALCQLLASRDVDAVGAHDASECLTRLRDTTFDCMVLDLSLPDSSGFALLEKISEDHTYSFPPVIIYTGRELSSDEEQRLRKYSKSIIIKGAKSPERLLDEVALFLHQVVAELPPEQQKMIEKARMREAALEGRRILLAEDDVRNIFALTSLLEPMGVQLEIARNGREALEALQNKPHIDLILMDIMMPEMDGLEAMRKIRENSKWAKIPIIALTAKAMPNDQQQCYEAGANDFLAKPLDVNKLVSLVRVWMPR